MHTLCIRYAPDPNWLRHFRKYFRNELLKSSATLSTKRSIIEQRKDNGEV